MGATAPPNPRARTAQSFLIWTLPALIGGFVLGLFLQGKFDWIKPSYVAVFALNLSWLIVTMRRIGQRQLGAAGFYWFLWLITMGALGYFFSPTNWTWWIGPAIGMGLGVGITVGWAFFLNGARQATSQPTVSNPIPPGANVVERHETLEASLGVPGMGKVDIGKVINSSAIAESLLSAAKQVSSATERASLLRQLRDEGTITKEQYLQSLLELGIVPASAQQAEPIQPITTTPAEIEWPKANIDWGGKPTRKARRQSREPR